MSGQPSSAKDSRLICSDFNLTLHSMTLSYDKCTFVGCFGLKHLLNARNAKCECKLSSISQRRQSKEERLCLDTEILYYRIMVTWIDVCRSDQTLILHTYCIMATVYDVPINCFLSFLRLFSTSREEHPKVFLIKNGWMEAIDVSHLLLSESTKRRVIIWPAFWIFYCKTWQLMDIVLQLQIDPLSSWKRSTFNGRKGQFRRKSNHAENSG